MSHRVFYDVSVRIVMRNGADAVVEVQSQNLVTERECKDVLDRAMRGLQSLKTPAVEEAPRREQFKVVG
jgi:uncharacterized membrane protein